MFYASAVQLSCQNGEAAAFPPGRCGLAAAQFVSRFTNVPAEDARLALTCASIARLCDINPT